MRVWELRIWVRLACLGKALSWGTWEQRGYFGWEKSGRDQEAGPLPWCTHWVPGNVLRTLQILTYLILLKHLCR